jgi:Tol biopolymer transport system component
MNKHWMKLIALLIVTFAGATLVRATPDGAISIRRLHPALPAYGQVTSYKLSPDEETVVYYAGDSAQNQYDLYAIPRRNAAAPVMLNRQGEIVYTPYIITSDSQNVIYNNGRGLVQVPLTGGAATTVTLPLSRTNNLGEVVANFWIAPDQQTLVYHVSSYPFAYEKLISHNLASGDETELAVSTNHIHVSGITAERLVYMTATNPQEPNVWRIYSVDVQGGQPIPLAAALPPAVSALPGQISPDGQTIVFTGYNTSPAGSRWDELYAAALDGSSLVRLSDPAHHNVASSFVISADSQSIVYSNTFTETWQTHLYAVPRGGGPATRLDPAQTTGVSVPAITPDSQTVVFIGTRLEGQVSMRRLYAVPITGGAALPLSGEDSRSLFFLIAQNGQSVVYAFMQTYTAGSIEPQKVPITGGAPVALSAFLGSASQLHNWQLSADGTMLVAIQRAPDRHTVYAFDLRTGTARVLNPAPFSQLYFPANTPYSLTKDGDVVMLARVIGGPAANELFVSMRGDVDQTHRLFLPLIQR